MSEMQQPPHGGSGDAESAHRPLEDRFRRHASALIRDGRSPLSAALMRGAAANLEDSGVMARLFVNVPVPPGSVPQLRLLAALHHLVLRGQAPQLAGFYPSAGGSRTPDGVWGAAVTTIEEHFDWIQDRLNRTVQTNEPGRSAVLYPALLWLSSRFHLPIRLIELGASAGLNLVPERYCYLVEGRALGDPSSAVGFSEPWQPAPDIDLETNAGELSITARAGCDRHPLDPRDPDDRITLLSYIWPDETPRIDRLRRALDIAAACSPPVQSGSAAVWVREALAARRPDELTVVWHSVFRQYLKPEEWARIRGSLGQAVSSDDHPPTAWVSMEPSHDHLLGLRLRISATGLPLRLAARCGDHGPPVRWLS